MYKIILTHCGGKIASKIKELITHEKIKQHGKESTNETQKPYDPGKGKESGKTNP